MIQTACHTVTWGRNLARALSEIRALGFAGFESFGPGMYGGESEYRTLVELSGIQLASIYTGGSFIYPDKTDAEVAAISAVIRLLESFGSRHLVLGGGHRRPEGNTREDCEVMAGTLNLVGRIAQEHGIRACYHPHPGTCIQTEPEIDRLLELTDPEVVFLCPDTGHFFQTGIDPATFISTHFSRVAYIHLRDAGDDGRFVGLGRGRVDLPAIFEVLHRSGYDGWLTIELDISLDTPAESARASLEYLKRFNRDS